MIILLLLQNVVSFFCETKAGARGERGLFDVKDVTPIKKPNEAASLRGPRMQSIEIR